jgi:hypothetical protein
MARIRKKIGDDPTITRKEQEKVHSENMASPKKRKASPKKKKAASKRKIDDVVLEDSAKKPPAPKKGLDGDKKPPAVMITQNPSSQDTGVADSVVAEVPFLEATAAMVTQNPSPQDTGVTDSVPLVATAAMITQNPSSQDTGVAEVSLAAMASIFSSFYPSPQESESVSRTLNFEKDSERSDNNTTDVAAPLMENAQISNRGIPEPNAEGEIGGNVHLEQEFAIPVVDSNKNLQITIQDDLPLSLDQNKKEWSLNNPLGSGKLDWLRIHHPQNKIYETGGEDLPLERRPVEPGIDQWMTNWHLSSMVRICFPNIDRSIIAKVNVITDAKSDAQVELNLFPLESFLPLSPWNNELSTEPESTLSRLCKFDIGDRSDGDTSPIKFRGNGDWVLPSKRRVLLGFFHRSANLTDEKKLSKHFLVHAKRIYELLNGAGDSRTSLKEVNRIAKCGECFFITAIQGQVQQDHVLSLVQFKQIHKRCTFINYMGTRSGTFEKKRFGTKTPFMRDDETFEGMGLALLLLRSVQLYLCCLGKVPQLYIQVVYGSRMHTYLLGVGFVIFTDDTMMATLKQREGYRILDDPKCIVLHSRGIISPKKIAEYWIRPKFDLKNYLRRPILPGERFGHGEVLFKFPFQVSGNYIDQTSSRLLFLGHPFFYHHQPEKICDSSDIFRKKNQVSVLGGQFRDYTTSPTTHWFSGKDIHWLSEWFLRDSDHPLLNDFAVLSTELSLYINSMENCQTTLPRFAQHLHVTLSANYDVLYKRFIFYYENVKNNHWIVHVFINPFAALDRVLHPKADPEFEYGYFTYDSFQSELDEDDQPHHYDQGCSRQLVFLLNLLSYYRDLAVHGLLEQSKPLETWEAIWGIGGRGPFGCYLHPGMGIGYDKHEESQLNWLPGRISHSTHLLLHQQDTYNCGLFCNLFVMDFILTQWRNTYSKGTNIIPSTYGLGSTFSVKDGERGDGEDICKLVRLEMICLIERLHVVNFNAYSREDRYLPLKAELDSDYEKTIKKSRFLTMLQKKYEEPRLPNNYEIEESLSIGKATRDCLRKQVDFNYTKESLLENGAAYKWKGVLFEGWKIHDLVVRLSPTFSRNHFYRELNHRVDKAIWEWHLAAYEKYNAHREKVREEEGTIIDITEDSPKKVPPPIAKNIELPIPRKVPSKTTKNVDLVSNEPSFVSTPEEANKINAAVVTKPKPRKKTTPEEANKIDAAMVTKPNAKKIQPNAKKIQATKQVPDKKKTSTTKVISQKKFLKENDNSKNMDKQPEPKNQKSKRMETDELTLEKNTQKENDHSSENSNRQQKGVQQEILTDSPVIADTHIEETKSNRASDDVTEEENEAPPGATVATPHDVLEDPQSTMAGEQEAVREEPNNSTVEEAVIANPPPKKSVTNKARSGTRPTNLPTHPSQAVKNSPVKKKSNTKMKIPASKKSPVKKKQPGGNSPSKKKRKQEEIEESEDETEPSVHESEEDTEISVHKSEGSSDDDKSAEDENEPHKRRTIVEEDSDDGEIMLSDEEDPFVDHVELIEEEEEEDVVPLFEQELILPEDEIRTRNQPKLYQQVQMGPKKSNSVTKKKKIDHVPVVKPNALKKKKWNMIENSLEIFPRWAAPPQINGIKYSNFYDPIPASEYDLKDVPLHQQSKKEARKMCSANMSREFTQKEFKAFVATIKDEDSKKAYERWWHQSGGQVEKEANLTYWRNDLYLRFVPSSTGRLQNKDGLLHGAYQSRVVTAEGEVQVVEVAPDWVHRNVDEDAQEIIHRVNKEWNEQHIDLNGRVESGFLTLEGNDTMKDKDGKVLMIDYKWDDRQISKVRYVPPKTFTTTKGLEKTFPERWRGLIRGLNDESDHFVWLESDWINKNLSTDFIGFLKTTRMAGVEGYVRIPEGSAEDQTQQMLSPCAKLPGAPKLKYRRAGTVEDNDRSCVLKSASSALSYLGYDRLAYLLCNDLCHGRKFECGFEFFQKCMEPKRLEKHERQKFQFAKLKKGLKKWNIFVDCKQHLMCLVGLYSSDCKTDHAVSIAGKWIFDSNFDFALPLCQESLDLCCSSDTKKCTYMGVTRVCMLKPVVNTLKNKNL